MAAFGRVFRWWLIESSGLKQYLLEEGKPVKSVHPYVNPLLHEPTVTSSNSKRFGGLLMIQIQNIE